MPLPWLKDKNDAHEFKPLLAEIEEDPGSPLGPLTFWLVVGVFAFFLGWTIWGQVDVVVTARGKVIPSGQVKLVQPLNGGVISRILVKEGDFVRKGQPLVEIDPSTTEPQLQFNQKTLSYVQAELNRLRAETGHGTFHASGGTQASLFRASVASLQKQLSAIEKQLENLQAQILARQAELKNTKETLDLNLEKEKRLREVRDIIARDDYDKVQNDILNGQARLKVLEHEIEQLTFQQQQTREEMAYLENHFHSTQLSELSEKEKQINQLQASIEEASFRNSRQTLVAPVDGYVNELFVHTIGGVVTPAQKVLSVVPVNMPLVVQATVLNKDIGFVRTGMPVSIKVDTFEFQKYGTLNGIVTRVDKDSRDDQKLGPVYTVTVNPLQHSLLVDGRWQSITSGLSVSAEIKTGKRRIIEFFIYPLIKYMNEGMSVR
jgi:hemolysin D